jgi:chromosome segregation protein
VIFKRLEIQGFKSFPDKTLVEFGPGLTAVVGPNGSGKSNVVDALKWVLGEQNPRVLRASRMEECIFSGSATRRPISRAEVSITFDNTRGIIPLNASEVMITRRLYRTGESEYFINQAPCRLKDVRDLFLGNSAEKRR